MKGADLSGTNLYGSRVIDQEFQSQISQGTIIVGVSLTEQSTSDSIERFGASKIAEYKKKVCPVNSH